MVTFSFKEINVFHDKKKNVLLEAVIINFRFFIKLILDFFY